MEIRERWFDMIRGTEKVLRKGLEIFCQNSKTSEEGSQNTLSLHGVLALFYLQQHQYQAEYIVHAYSLSNFYNDVYLKPSIPIKDANFILS